MPHLVIRCYLFISLSSGCDLPWHYPNIVDVSTIHSWNLYEQTCVNKTAQSSDFYHLFTSLIFSCVFDLYGKARHVQLLAICWWSYQLDLGNLAWYWTKPPVWIHVAMSFLIQHGECLSQPYAIIIERWYTGMGQNLRHFYSWMDELPDRLCFSRMRSKGSRFTLGSWGLRVCSLDVAPPSATVRNQSGLV